MEEREERTVVSSFDNAIFFLGKRAKNRERILEFFDSKRFVVPTPTVHQPVKCVVHKAVKDFDKRMNIRRHIVNMASASLDSGSCNRFHPTSNHNIVVGLNGALQKRFVLPSGNLVPGNVHRASHVDFGVGGKGQDVAIALHCLLDRKVDDCENDGIDNTSKDTNIRLVQFIGTGFAGDAVYSLLENRLGEETMIYTVRSSSEMRTCTSIVAADETTELVEPSGVITKTELDELFSIISNNENEESKDISPRSLCIMGSMPPGCSEDTYAKIYQKLAGPNTVCVVDSLAGTIPLLQTISQSGNSEEPNNGTGPVLFKMNASELCKLAGTPKSNSETDGISLSELILAIEGFLSKYPVISDMNESHDRGVIGLAITDGKHNGYFVAIRNTKQEDGVLNPYEVFQLPVPNLGHGGSRTLYPIGAGGK